MARRKRTERSHRNRARQSNKKLFNALLDWLIPEGELFTEGLFHGNIKWKPEQLAQQAVIWSWQDTRNVTDAFDQTIEIGEDLGVRNVAKTYASFMDALVR